MGEQMNLSTFKKLDGRTLKIIAVLSMLIDHTGAVLFPNILWLRMIGRLAFPIYCFLLVEGAHYTHHFSKYILRMVLFALISEVPFDLAFYNQIPYGLHQNVFFTLGIGLVMIWFIENIESEFNFSTVLKVIMKMLMFIAAGMLAEQINTDYGFAGIAIIFIFYILRNKPLLKYVLVGAICIEMSWLEGFAVLALLLIALYNGERGRQNRIMQYGFYAFYPVHLLVLYFISQMMKMI
jgi:hypothetical protein